MCCACYLVSHYTDFRDLLVCAWLYAFALFVPRRACPCACPLLCLLCWSLDHSWFCAAMQDKVVRLVMERDAALAVLNNRNDNKDVKMQTLSEAFIKKKQDELSNDYFYEILQDKISKLLEDRNVQNKRYTSLVHDLISTCDNFGDLLPLKMIDIDQSTSEHAETGFIFTGSKTNPSRTDQLALALLKILRDGIIYETKHTTTEYCKFLTL